MANYFEELLDSYSKLKKRQLRINLSKVNEGAATEAEAEQQLLAAIRTAAGMEQPYMPFGSEDFTFQVTKTGKNKGNIGVYYEGLGSNPRTSIATPEGIKIVSDVIWNKLIKVFMDGGPGKGSMASSEDLEKQIPGEEADPDPEVLSRNDLDKLHPNLSEYLNKGLNLVHKLMDQGFLSDDDAVWVKNWSNQSMDKDRPRRYLRNHFFGNVQGGIPRQILSTFTEGKESVFALPKDGVGELLTQKIEPDDVARGLELQNQLFEIMLRQSDDKMTEEDALFLKQHIRYGKRDGKLFVWYRGDLDQPFGISFDYSKKSPMRLFFEEFSSTMKEEFSDALIEQSMQAGSTASRGSLNQIFGNATEKLFMAAALDTIGAREAAFKIRAQVGTVGGESLKRAFQIKDLTDSGEIIATEETEELSELIDNLVKRGIGPEEALISIAKRMHIIANKFLRKNSEGRDFILHSGGKTGGGRKADVVEGGFDKDKMLNGLRAYGMSKEQAKDKLVPLSVRGMLEEHILTKKERNMGPTKKEDALSKAAAKLAKENGLKSLDLDDEVYTHNISLKVYHSASERKLGESSTILGPIKHLRDKKSPFTQKIRDRLGIDEDKDVSKEYDKLLKNLYGKIEPLDTTLGTELKVNGVTEDGVRKTIVGILKENGITEETNNIGQTKEINSLLERMKESISGGDISNEQYLIKAYLERKVVTHNLVKHMRKDDKTIDVTKNTPKSKKAKAARALLASVNCSVGAPSSPSTIFDGTLNTGGHHFADADEYSYGTMREFVDGGSNFSYKKGTTVIHFDNDGKLGAERGGKNAIFTSSTHQDTIHDWAGISSENTDLPEDTSESFLKDFLDNQQKILEKLFNSI